MYIHSGIMNFCPFSKPPVNNRSFMPDIRSSFNFWRKTKPLAIIKYSRSFQYIYTCACIAPLLVRYTILTVQFNIRADITRRKWILTRIQTRSFDLCIFIDKNAQLRNTNLNLDSSDDDQEIGNYK